MEKFRFIYTQLGDLLAQKHMRHVQVLYTKKNGKFLIKLASLDEPGLKEKVKELVEYYFCESLTLVEEKKTVLFYEVYMF